MTHLGIAIIDTHGLSLIITSNFEKYFRSI